MKRRREATTHDLSESLEAPSATKQEPAEMMGRVQQRTRQTFCTEPSGLTPELTRAAKRHRVE